jgi:HEAT repeat protein
MRNTRVSVVLCAVVLVMGLGLAALPGVAHAFEWEGKLRVTVSKLGHSKLKVRLAALQKLGQFPMRKVARHLLVATQDLDNDTYRVTAARMLVEHRVDAVVPVLVEWLSDFELAVRVEAARLLGRMGSAATVGPLLRTFGDFEHKVRMAAVLALGRIGSRKAITGILGRLNDPNVKVRKAAIHVLSELTDPRAVIPLLGKLTDPSREIREATVKTLAKIADPRAVPPLLRLLKDPTVQVRVAAIAALGSLRSPTAVAALIDLFNRSNAVKERQAVVKTLGRLSTPAARRTLVKALFDPSLGRATRDALVLSGRRAVGLLAKTLNSSRISLYSATLIVQILRDIGDRRASRALVREFNRGRVGRKIVVEALATCGDTSALVPLLVVVAGEKKAQRRLALGALLHIADRRAIVPLLPVLASTDSTSRLMAVRLMGRLRATRAVPALLKMLDKDTPPIRVAAAAALGRIGDKKVGRQLVPLLSAKDRDLRRAAFNALASLRPTALVGDLLKIARNVEEDTPHRATALDAVGAIGRAGRTTDHQRIIIALASDSNQSVATAAVTAMGAIRNPAFAPPLLQLLPKASKGLSLKVIQVLGNFPSAAAAATLRKLLGDKSPKRRAMAVWALGRQGRFADRKALVRALRDAHLGVRINAIGALTRLGYKPAVAPLRKLLRSGETNPNLRAAAVLGLGRLGDRPSALTIATLLKLDLTNRALETNIIRTLLALGWSKKKVMRRVESRGDEDLVRIAQKLARPKPGKKRTWVGIDILDDKGHHKRGLPIILILPDGMIRWTLTDERGKVYEEQIAPGTVRYEYVRRVTGSR